MSEEFCTAQANGVPCMSVRDLFEWAEEQGLADLPMKFNTLGEDEDGYNVCNVNVVVETDFLSAPYADTDFVILYYDSIPVN